MCPLQHHLTFSIFNLQAVFLFDFSEAKHFIVQQVQYLLFQVVPQRTTVRCWVQKGCGRQREGWNCTAGIHGQVSHKIPSLRPIHLLLTYIQTHVF